MSFRPSALSNPQQVLTYKPKMPFTPGKKPVSVPTLLPKTVVENEEEKEEKSEGMPQWAKVLIGVGVAGVLGFGVFKLLGK
jgi:hypothetical protein